MEAYINIQRNIWSSAYQNWHVFPDSLWRPPHFDPRGVWEVQYGPLHFPPRPPAPTANYPSYNRPMARPVASFSDKPPQPPANLVTGNSGKLSDVKMKPLPVFKVVKNVLVDEYYGSIFNHSRTYSFRIDAGLIIDKRPGFEVVLRMAVLHFGSILSDELPLNVNVRVNEKSATLSNAKSPIVITKLSKLDGSYNTLCISSAMERNRRFLVQILIMARENVEDLCKKLNKKALTTALEDIKRNAFQKGGDIALASSFPLSLQCPLLKTRIELPGRSKECTHPQCFDLTAHIRLNADKASWSCPICFGSAELDELCIDEFVAHVLKTTSNCDMKIFLLSDGSWSVKSVDESEPEQLTDSASKKRVLMIDLTEDDGGKSSADENVNILTEEPPGKSSHKAKRSRLDNNNNNIGPRPQRKRKKPPRFGQ
ncbi:E3 SUMO-protein ligase PIAS1-like [Macrobrachium nipponense]|uniref:E3 SUMO-protein ligase PIAS1-like n=1 Tax=Macrobrachium nipponense TaxID=159736 RepID=UPI0030C7C554